MHLLAGFRSGLAVCCLYQQRVGLILQLNVDHACYGVGAILGCRPVTRHLNALDRVLGDGIHVIANRAAATCPVHMHDCRCELFASVSY